MFLNEFYSYKHFVQNYFRKISFFKQRILLINCTITKIYKMLEKLFCCYGRRNLVRRWNRWGGGERGLEVQMNLMPPGVLKVNIFSLFWIFQAASCGGHDSLPDSIFLYKIWKKNPPMIFLQGECFKLNKPYITS